MVNWFQLRTLLFILTSTFTYFLIMCYLWQRLYIHRCISFHKVSPIVTCESGIVEIDYSTIHLTTIPMSPPFSPTIEIDRNNT